MLAALRRKVGRIVSWGAFLLAFGIMAGAFGAHVLEQRLEPHLFAIYQKAAWYHVVHAFGLLVIPLLCQGAFISERGAKRVSILILVGIILFSGSLYLLALTGIRGLGAVTPFGGSAWIVAWVWLGFEARKREAKNGEASRGK